ncbi:MAG: lactonase family protein [Nitrospira sp. BO4]|nr:lactonase family protein [Nitrospira sp. BO4]
MTKWLMVWLFTFAWLLSGCGDGGGEGGAFGGLGTIGGGVGTTSIIYVTNSGSNNVSGYSINAATGALVPIAGSPFANLPGPSAIAISSDGFFTFVASSRANNVTAFRVSTDGGLILVPSTGLNPNPAAVGTTPGAMAISSDTKYLYVVNGGSDNVTAFNIGAAGVLTPIPPAAGNSNPVSVGGSDPASVVISPIGKFLFVANSGSNDVSAFSIGGTGLLTLIPPSGTSRNPISTGGTASKGIAISPNGSFLYVANSGSNDVTVFQIAANGLLSLVPPAGSSANPIPVGSTTPNAIVISQDGQFVYTANGGGTVTAFTIGSGGLLTLVPSSAGSLNPAPAGTTPVAMTFSSDGQFLYVVNRGGRVSAYAIAQGTGGLAPLSPLFGNPFPAGTTPSAIATPG